MEESLKKRYIEVFNDNVNVSKDSDLKEALYVLLAIFSILGILYFFSGLIINVFIDNMSFETQQKMERLITLPPFRAFTENKKDIILLNGIKNKIIKNDDLLKRKKDFNLTILKEKNVNAFIFMNGSIVVTTGLLNMTRDKEILSFVLAHELGHYKNRDHLKSLGKTLLFKLIYTIAISGESQISTNMSHMEKFFTMKYSQEREFNADKYANDHLIKKYGSNKGAIKFFNLMKKEKNMPDFLYYFATHPSLQARIEKLN